MARIPCSRTASPRDPLYAGFPVSELARLFCPEDDGALNPQSDVRADTLWNATLRCAACGRAYPVEEGILKLLDPASLDTESDHERQLRDRNLSAGYDFSDEESDMQLAEVHPMLESAALSEGTDVLELGAGAGRHTVRIATRRARIVAVDFSIDSLRRLSARAEGTWRIALVQADCTRLSVRARSFDVVVSTLVSNLPTKERRDSMMALAARAIKPAGRFVFSAHHYGLHSRLAREPRSGRYFEGGIYRYLFGKREMESETRDFFADVVCRPIQIEVPFARRFGLPALKTSRLAERVPLVNRFGWLLLVIARAPRAVKRS